MDTLPLNNNTGILFDTAVDSLNNPKQFVKFKNHQYLIIGLLEVDIFNKLHYKYTPQNKKEEQLRARAGNLTTKPHTNFNSKLCFKYEASGNTGQGYINQTRSLYWLKPVGFSYKEVKLQIPDSGKCIFTNIGEKFILKKKHMYGEIVVNRICIKTKDINLFIIIN